MNMSWREWSYSCIYSSVLALIQVSGLFHALAAFPTRHKRGWVVPNILSFCYKWFQSHAKTYFNYLLTFIKTPCFTTVYTRRKFIFHLKTWHCYIHYNRHTVTHSNTDMNKHIKKIKLLILHSSCLFLCYIAKNWS
jgi:murein L,D-transpeptidase YafK